MKGIDVSHWNGSINWQEVGFEQDFVIMKISQRTSTDVRFAQYYADARSHGFTNIGGYIYNKVKTVEEAKKEADHAVEALRQKTLPFGVWLDMEDASMKRLGRQLLTEIIETEASILRQAGFRVGIYCNRDWYLNVLDSAKLSKNFVFWIARYPKNDNGTIKESLSPLDLDGCAIWQYSSKGKVAGIAGNVDMNITDNDIQSILRYETAKTYTCPYPMPTTTLYRRKIGMKEKDVMWMQWWLAKHKFYTGNIDGKFGPITNGALLSFQRKYTPSCVDGKCGPATRKALTELKTY